MGTLATVPISGATWKPSPSMILSKALGPRSCTLCPAQPRGPCVSPASGMRLERYSIWIFICSCSKQFQVLRGVLGCMKLGEES